MEKDEFEAIRNTWKGVVNKKKEKMAEIKQKKQELENIKKELVEINKTRKSAEYVEAKAKFATPASVNKDKVIKDQAELIQQLKANMGITPTAQP